MESSRMLKKLEQMAPAILGWAGAIGVVVTAVLAVKVTPKAMEAIQSKAQKEDEQEVSKLEAVKEGWKFYIPAAVAGATSIACILIANVLNKKQQVSIVSAYALLNHSYNEYKRKVIDIYGKEAHDVVMESIAADRVARDHVIHAPNCFRNSCLDFEGADEEERLFYDDYSKRYFTSTISKVLQAEYHLNRNLALDGGGIYLNEFYDLLGIEKIKEGDSIGWFINDDVYWIDFNHVKATIDDGLECWVIEMIIEPGTEDDFLLPT